MRKDYFESEFLGLYKLASANSEEELMPLALRIDLIKALNDEYNRVKKNKENRLTNEQFKAYLRAALDFADKYKDGDFTSSKEAAAKIWHSIALESCAIANKNGNAPFLSHLLLAVTSELERRYLEKLESAKEFKRVIEETNIDELEVMDAAELLA